MMRTLLLSTAAVLFVSGNALAADLYAKAPPPPAAYDWSGVYVGGHIGGGWDTATFQDPSAGQVLANCCVFADLAPGAAASKGNGSAFLGGAQIGWNYQIGRLVIGSDFDISGTSLKANGSGFYPAGFPGDVGDVITANETFGVRTDWTATATSTVGIAAGRWLWYSKAGVAWAHNTYSLGLASSGFSSEGPFGFASTNSDTRVGWTVGTGIAWAWTDSWSVKLEYDYLDFATKAYDFSGHIANNEEGIPTSTFNTTNSLQISEVKFGVNYKFQPGFLFW
jgi:outer membrane immunogenic protein